MGRGARLAGRRQPAGGEWRRQQRAQPAGLASAAACAGGGGSKLAVPQCTERVITGRLAGGSAYLMPASSWLRRDVRCNLNNVVRGQ